MPEEMPVFVRIEEYKDVLDIMNMIKNKLAEAREILNKLNEIKNDEDAELELWRTGVDEVQRKVDLVDRSLFEPTNV